MARNVNANLARALSSGVYDPYGVSAGSGQSTNRLIAKQLLSQGGRFRPRNGQYPHSQGLADLASQGLGLYANYKANEDAYAKDDRIAQALMAQVQGGGIGQTDMPQRQPRTIQPFQDDMQTEMEPDGPDMPTQEQMPPPQQTAGFDTSQYDPFFKKGPKGHYNLPMAQMGHRQYMAGRKEYRQNTREDRIRKEKQIIAAQNKTYDREIAEKKYLQSERKFDAAQITREQTLENTRLTRQAGQERLQLAKQNYQRGVKEDAARDSHRSFQETKGTAEYGNKVREKYMTRTGEFIEVRRNYNVLQQNLKLNSGEGDFFALQSLFQMVEPNGRGMTSVGQMQEAYNARAIPEKIAMFFKQFLENDKLSTAQRKQLRTVGKNIHGTEMRDAKFYMRTYRDELKDSKMFGDDLGRIKKLIPDLTTVKMENMQEDEYGDMPTLGDAGEIIKKTGVKIPLDKAKDTSLVKPTTPGRNVPENLQSIANAWDVGEVTLFRGIPYKVVLKNGRKIFEEVFTK